MFLNKLLTALKPSYFIANIPSLTFRYHLYVTVPVSSYIATTTYVVYTMFNGLKKCDRNRCILDQEYIIL